MTQTGLSWANAQWADGPSIYAFLATRGVIARLSAVGTDSWEPDQDVVAMREIVYKWKRGSRASVAKVDEVLVRFDIHLSEVPDEVWCRLRRPRHDRRAA